jgi:hypothetical protein
MPFDGIADPVAAKSLQALGLMEDRLQGGRKWTRHFMFRDGGKMCLLGASYFGGSVSARASKYSWVDEGRDFSGGFQHSQNRCGAAKEVEPVVVAGDLLIGSGAGT